MVYESQITFTLDTVCPWTYLAKKRLDRALTQFTTTSPSSNITFTLSIAPYQLSPDLSTAGTNKHEWYKTNKFAGSEERTRLLEEYMKAVFSNDDLVFEAHDDAVMANTMNAHRVLGYVQENAADLVDENHAAGLASKVLDNLYAAYFADGKHPSSPETLLTALVAAGISQDKAKTIVEDENLGLADVKAKIREQSGNGVDSVPYVVFEGKRRDITIVGAKEVEEYVKVLEQVAKEAA